MMWWQGPTSHGLGLSYWRKSRGWGYFKIGCRIRYLRLSGDEVPQHWGRLHNGELHGLNFSPNIIRMIVSWRMRWAGHVASMRQRRRAYRIFVGKSEGKRQLGISGRRWEDNTNMQRKGIKEGAWIGLSWLWIGTSGGLMNCQVP